MATRIQFVIPGRLPTWNTFYAGTHWGRRRRIAEEWKAAAMAAILQETGGKRLKLRPPVRLEVVVRYRRPRDLDNVCLKPVIDALVSLGMIPDDTAEVLRDIRLRAENNERDEVLVVVSEV